MDAFLVLTVIIGLLAILGALGVLLRRMFRGAGPSSSEPGPPYGVLPGLGPVGPLGGLSPDADVSDTGSSSNDLFGV
jgi:hypothetical protein